MLKLLTRLSKDNYHITKPDIELLLSISEEYNLQLNVSGYLNGTIKDEPAIGLIELFLNKYEKHYKDELTWEVIHHFKGEIKNDPLHEYIQIVVDFHCLSFNEKYPKTNYQYIQKYIKYIF